MKHLTILLFLFCWLEINAQIGSGKNYVIRHQSANQRYELLAIPHSDAGPGEVSVYVYERKTNTFLYEFTEEYMTDNLYILSDDGKWVYEFYANLCAEVRDPNFLPMKRYYNGELKDTIWMGTIPVNFSNLIADKNFNYRYTEHRQKKLHQRWKSRRSDVALYGDTLRFTTSFSEKNMAFYYSLPEYQPCGVNLDYDPASEPQYEKMMYEIRYMNIYRRERLCRKTIKRLSLQ